MPAAEGSDERSPLLAAADERSNEDGNQRHEEANESSPLLSRQTSGDTNIRASSAHSGTNEPQSRRKRRWPSFIAMAILATLVIVVMVLGFVVPPAVKQYVEEALVLEPTDLSVESLTAEGVHARVRATFRLDGSRVRDENAQRIGRIATSIMRQIGTEETKLRVHLPHYGNALLGSAFLPPINLNLVDGKATDLDFVTEFAPGDTETARKVVNEWLQGNLHHLKVTGATAVSLKSGILPLGTHDVVESMVFEANKLPSMPEYTINNLLFYDVPIGDESQKGVGANVSITAYNEFPVGLKVPSLEFEVLVPNCDASHPHIKVASASSSVIMVRPKHNVTVEAQGIIRELPESLTRACPSSELSPLDHFMKRYLHGEEAVVFVRGKAPENDQLPEWIGDFIASIIVPIQFPGRSLDNFLRNFTLEDVDFELPSPFADPGDPAGKPRVSGTVRVLAAIPADLNIDIQVESLRANGDLFYEGHKFGELNIDEWQKAKSTIINQPGDEEDLLSVTSRIVNVPIEILDGDIFSDIMQQLLFGDKDIILDVTANVDVKVSTVLGDLVVRGVPATDVPGDTLAALNLEIGEVRMLDTRATGVHLQALVNMTNPTRYTASIPFMSVHILKGEHLIGEASTTKPMILGHGKNTGIEIDASWDPLAFGGKKAHETARRLLSEYLSGDNITMTLRAHRGSFPTAPVIGEALSKINLTVPAPRLHLPGDGDGEDGQGFIRDATFHILSSTAVFTLASPLGHDTVHIEYINATAFYNKTENVGQIVHQTPFSVPPGLSQTPRLPVHWSADHAGYDKLKDALGGTLKLDAVADVTVRVGNWVENVDYRGKGLGARVTW